MDINQLEELTGYKLTKEELQPSNVWDVPFSKHEDRNSKDEWVREVAAEVPDIPEATVENTDAPEADQGAEETVQPIAGRHKAWSGYTKGL